MQGVPEHETLDTSPERRTPEPTGTAIGHLTPPSTPPASGDIKAQSAELVQDDSHNHEEFDDVHIEEPVVQSIQTVQPASRQVISKARMVTVPKRVPPKLPPRNPNRGDHKGPLVIGGSPNGSPTKEGATSPGLSDHIKEVAFPSALADDPVDGVGRSMDEISLEDDEALERPDMWAKVQEAKHVHEEEARQGVQMPGGFN